MSMNPDWLGRLWPNSLATRLAAILLLGLLATQGLSLWLQWGERSAVVSQARGLNFADRLARTVSLLEAVSAAGRPTALAALQDAELQVTLLAEDQVSPNPPRGPIASLLAERLGSARQIRHAPVSAGAALAVPQREASQRNFDVRLADGQWLRIRLGRNAESGPPAWPVSLIVQLLLTLLGVMLMVLLALRQTTLPLARLAQAADALGQDLDAPPLSEQGSTETRSAAQAFNRMQTRIRKLLTERAGALAAVSHDLRTPLTRLRLRTELVDDPALREQMTADLEAMAAMIDGTLDYLRGLQTNELLRAIDINALLDSMADDARVLGRSIQIQGQALQPFPGRLTALRRALQNLIDNAFQYGQGASIRVQDSASQLDITVQDDGPGLADAELTKVTEAYYRVDRARQQPGGSVGLGLSIVKDVALLHGGELLLANRPAGGLAATLSLPRR